MIKKLLLIFIMLVSSTVMAGQDIAALVNDEPITNYELQARKKMLMVLNNIKNADSNIMNQINNAALNSLIEEELLSQHAKKTGQKISSEDIDRAIESIDQRNNRPKGALLSFLKAGGVDVENFRSQIKSELIKMNLMSYLSRTVAVSPKEIDTIILDSNQKDAKIVAKIFTSLNKESKTLKSMYNLQKHSKTCANLKETSYNKFANVTEVNGNFSNLDPQLQSLVKDLRVNHSSSVFETEDGFRFVLLCEKEIISLTAEENMYVNNFLVNKKMSQKAQKFFSDLKKKAYIKIMTN